MDKLSISSQAGQAHTHAHSGKALGSVNHRSSQPKGDDEQKSSVKGDKVTLSAEGKEQARSITAVLSKSDATLVRQLEKRDSEVRTHEQAHLNAAGGYAQGGAKYSYSKGPDGKSYATEGSVAIDVSPETTPEATIAKMRTVREAALAPASPSAADKNVAARATAQEASAQRQLSQQNAAHTYSKAGVVQSADPAQTALSLTA